MADDLPVPLLKDPKFLVTAGTIVLATVLVSWAIIAPGDWKSVVQFVLGAYLGVPHAN